MREQYIPSKAELLIHNIKTVEAQLNIHINTLKDWSRWEDLVKNWLAYCESPKQYADTVVVDMVKLYYTEKWGE